MTHTTLRSAAEDLRDGAARLAAAIIGGRVEDAAYTYNALIVDTIKDLELQLQQALRTLR